jgi:hypothetical protein
MQAIKEHEEFRSVSNHSYLLHLMEARGRIDDPTAPKDSCSVMQFSIIYGCFSVSLC